MREDGNIAAQGSMEEDLLGSVRDMIVAANDVADLHRAVIDGRREVIGRESVCLQDDHVIQRRVVHRDAAIDEIIERGAPFRRKTKPQRAVPPLPLQAALLLLRQVAAPTIVARRHPAPECLLASGLQLLPSAIARVCRAQI